MSDLKLFIAIILLCLTYQVRIMTLAFTVFKKSTFQNVTYHKESSHEI